MIFKDNRKAFRFVANLLKYTIVFFVVFYLFKKIDFQFEKLNQLLTFKTIFTLILLKFCIYAGASWRLRYVLSNMNAQLSAKDAYGLTLMGLLFTYLLPGSVTADVSKVYLARGTQIKTSLFMTALFIDRIAGLLSIFFIFLFAIVWAYFNEFHKLLFMVYFFKFQMSYMMAMLCFVFCICLFFVGRFLFKKATNFSKGVLHFHRVLKLKFWIKVLLLSGAIHFAWILFFVFVANQLQLEQIDLLGTGLIFPLVTVATIIPLTPASLGVGQILYQSLFNIYSGTSLNQAALVFTVVQIFDVLFVVQGVGFFIHRALTTSRPFHKSEP